MFPPGPSEPLLIVLQHTPEDSFEPDAVAEAPFTRFVAYETGRRLFGWVRLREGRLTDLLNAHEQLRLLGVELETFESARTETVEEMDVRARDLVAVQAGPPRGAEALRHHTRTFPVAVQAGPYLVRGHLHATHGDDPLESFRERPVFVPLTTAGIERWSGGRSRNLAVGTIIVNRLHVDWIRLVTDDELVEGVILPTGQPLAGAP